MLEISIITHYCAYLFVLKQGYALSAGYPDITGHFPAENPKGASSAISIDRDQHWDLFTRKDFNGRPYTMKPGERWPNFVEKGINDKIESIATR